MEEEEDDGAQEQPADALAELLGGGPTGEDGRPLAPPPRRSGSAARPRTGLYGGPLTPVGAGVASPSEAQSAAETAARATERQKAIAVEYQALLAKANEQEAATPGVPLDASAFEPTEDGASLAEDLALLVQDANRVGADDGDLDPQGQDDEQARLDAAQQAVIRALEGQADPSMLPLGLISGRAVEDDVRDPFEGMGLVDVDDPEIRDAGRSLQARLLWLEWVKQLHKNRKADPLRWHQLLAMQQDLQLGPRDGNGLRHTSRGFRRQRVDDDPFEIVWEYRRKGRGALKAGQSARVVLQKLREARGRGAFFQFRPARLPLDAPGAELKRRQLRPPASKPLATRGGGGKRQRRRAPEEEDEDEDMEERSATEGPGIAPPQGGRQSQRGERGVHYGGGRRIELDSLGARQYEQDEDGNVYAKTVPRLGNFAYARRATDGKRILGPDGAPLTVPITRPVKKATGVLRLQVVSIRLNERHWEWGYSRWLKNTAMFDTPSMAPYHGRAEFETTNSDGKKVVRGEVRAPGGKSVGTKMWERGTAIPLLTRGSMNVSGVNVTHVNEALPALLVPNRAALAGMTLAQVEALPRIRTTKAGLAKLKDRADAAPVTANTTDGHPIRCLALGEGAAAEVYWHTLFATPDSTGYRFYANAYACNDQATATKGGYDSWEGHGSVLATIRDAAHWNKDGIADRMRHLFEGHPLYFCNGNAAGGQQADVAKAGVGKFSDVRTHVPEGNRGTSKDDSGFSRYYSDVYRQLMFEPLPLAQTQTLPARDAQFRVDDVPNFLNFTQDRYVDRDLKEAQRPDGGGKRRAEAPEAAANQYGRFGAVPAPPNAVRVGLDQFYPETVMFPPRMVRERKRATLEFLSTPVGKSMHDSGAFGAPGAWPPAGMDTVRKKGAAERDPEYLAEWRRGMAQLPPSAGILAPTRLEDAVRRYVATHGDALSYAKTVDGQIQWLNTSALNGVNEAGGVYYSCRVDTGIGPGEGGLDSFFPLSNDADVYAIADVSLARGVHDYLQEPAWAAPASTTLEYRSRAGPPAWWRAEVEHMQKTASGHRDDRLAWAPGAHLAEPLLEPRARYDQLRAPSGIPKDSRRALFATDQLRRLDTADPHQGGTDQLRPLETALDDAGVKAEVDRARARNVPWCDQPAEAKERLPATLRMSTGLVWSKDPIIKTRPHNYQTVLFCKSFPRAGAPSGACPPPPAGATDQELALQAVEALPHRHDLRLSTMPFYPTRLSLTSRQAVWNRLNAAYAAEDAKTPPEVGAISRSLPGTVRQERTVEMAGGARATDAPQPELAGAAQGQGDERAQAETGWRKTLVAPLYVVALDFDDWKNAFEEGNRAWHAFFSEGHRKAYLVKKDMFVVTQLPNGGPNGRYLAPNPAYVWPMRDNPPRVGGSFETKDAPETAEHRRELELAVRPAERMRPSWFEDWKRFGGRPSDPNDDPQAVFMAEVDDWVALYQRYEDNADSWRTFEEANGRLRDRSEAVRKFSMRVCWGLARLGSQLKDGARGLFGDDGALERRAEGRRHLSLEMAPLMEERPQALRAKTVEALRAKTVEDAQSGAAPTEQQLRDEVAKHNVYESNMLRIWFYRATIPIFLIDLLDQLRRLRKEIGWFQFTHAQLLDDKAWGAESSGARTHAVRLKEAAEHANADRRTRVPYVIDFLNYNYRWPDVREMDAITLTGGEAIRELLLRFMHEDIVGAAAPLRPGWDEFDPRSGTMTAEDRADMWRSIKAKARRLANSGDARYAMDAVALKTAGSALLRLLNDASPDADSRRNTRFVARKLWAEATDRPQLSEAERRDATLGKDDADASKGTSFDLMLVLSTVAHGPSVDAQTYASHPLAIALQPGLYAFVDAWQDAIVHWRVAKIVEMHQDWQNEGAEEDVVRLGLRDIVTRLGVDYLGVANTAFDVDLSLPRWKRKQLPQDAPKAYPDLEAVVSLFGLQGETQYARELAVLDWASQRSFDRSRPPETLFAPDPGPGAVPVGQFMDLGADQRLKDYAQLSATFNAFSQVFVRLVKQNDNEHIAARISDILNDREPAQSQMSYDLLLAQAREKITNAMRHDGAAAAQAVDLGFVPATVLYAIEVLEEELQRGDQSRRERQEQLLAQAADTKADLRIKKFIKKLTRTNKLISSALGISVTQLAEVQRKLGDPGLDEQSRSFLTMAQSNLNLSIGHFKDYAKRARQLAEFLSKEVMAHPVLKTDFLRIMDQRQKRRAGERAAATRRQRLAAAGAGPGPSAVAVVADDETGGEVDDGGASDADADDDVFRAPLQAQPTAGRTPMQQLGMNAAVGAMRPELVANPANDQALAVQAMDGGDTDFERLYQEALRMGAAIAAQQVQRQQMAPRAGAALAAASGAGALAASAAAAADQLPDNEVIQGLERAVGGTTRPGGTGWGPGGGAALLKGLQAWQQPATRKPGLHVIAKMAELGLVQKSFEDAGRALDEAAKASEEQLAKGVRAFMLNSVLLKRRERSWQLVRGAVLALPLDGKRIVDELNAAFESGAEADFRVAPDRFSWAEYTRLAALPGTADPSAAPPEDAEDYGVNGWTGSYRRYIADCVRLVPSAAAAGGMRYKLDALPLTPSQWLRSSLSEGPHPQPAPAPLAPGAAPRYELFGTSEASLEDEALAGAGSAVAILIQAERDAAANRARPTHAPWAFDFDGLAPSETATR